MEFHLNGEDRKPPYHYTECGLDDIYLCGGYDIEPTPYGEAVSIKYEEELLEAIGIFLVTEKKVLSGKELRFLRKQMDLTQAELGRWVGLSAQQVARWEKDQYDIPGPADHLLRILYLEHLGRSINVRELIAALEETDSETSLERHEFVRTNEGWRPKLAA